MEESIRSKRSQLLYTFGYYINEGYWDTGEIHNENFVSEETINQDKELAIKVLNMNDIYIDKYNYFDICAKCGCTYDI